MTSRTLLVGALLVALAAGVSRAEEINPVVGKAGEFTLREADLDRFIDALPAEAQQQLRKIRSSGPFWPGKSCRPVPSP